MNNPLPIDQSHSGSSRTDLWAFLILAFTVFLIYGSSLRFEFTIWDDHEHVTKNPLVIHPGSDSLIKIWTAPYLELFMPMTYTFWMLESIPAKALAANEGGSQALSPSVYHFGTVLVFFACCYQVYRLISRLVTDRTAALIGAILFAVHPLQVESASWISENKGLIATFFGMWAMGVYIDSIREERSSRSLYLYCLSTVLFIAALLGKPWAVAIPCLAATIDFCFLRQPILKVAKRIAPWIVIAVGMILVMKRVQSTAELIQVDVLKRPYLAIDALVFYVQKLFVPYPLLIDYGRTPIAVLKNTSQPELVGAIGFGVIGAILIALAYFRQWRTLGILCLFLAALLPNLGLIPFAFQGYSTVADRYVAPALIAPALAAAFIMQWLHRPIFKALVILPIIVLAGLSWKQSQVWRNDEALFTNTIVHNRRSPAALMNRSKARSDRGDFEGGMRDAKDLFTQAWDYLPAYLNYAGCNVSLGRYDEALKTLDQVLAIKPDYSNALETKVLILQHLRRYNDALTPIKALRSIKPDDRSLKLRQARLLILTGNGAEGLKLFEEVSGKRTSRAEGEFIEAQVFEQAGEFKDAIKRYRFIVGHFPGNTDLADARLAWVLATATNSEDRKPDEALRIIQRIVGRTKSPNALQLDILAAAQAATGDFASAITTANEAKLNAQRERNTRLEEEINRRLALYTDRKPFIVGEAKIAIPPSPR